MNRCAQNLMKYREKNAKQMTIQRNKGTKTCQKRKRTRNTYRIKTTDKMQQ